MAEKSPTVMFQSEKAGPLGLSVIAPNPAKAVAATQLTVTASTCSCCRHKTMGARNEHSYRLALPTSWGALSVGRHPATARSKRKCACAKQTRFAAHSCVVHSPPYIISPPMRSARSYTVTCKQSQTQQIASNLDFLSSIIARLLQSVSHRTCTVVQNPAPTSRSACFSYNQQLKGRRETCSRQVPDTVRFTSPMITCGCSPHVPSC